MLKVILFYAVTILAVSLVSVILYLLYLASYWKRKGVPSKGNPIVGVFKDAFKVKKNIGVCLKDHYDQTKHDEKFYGTFILGQPILVVQDLELLKQILVKEYSSFSSHGRFNDSESDPLSKNLFNMHGSEWKFMRTKLTPTFSSSKIKYMFNTVQECIATFLEAVDKERSTNNNVVDVREVLARLGTDIIVSVAFGIEANSMKDTEAEFRKMGRAHLAPSVIKLIRFVLLTNFKLSKALGIQGTVPAVSRFILNAITQIVEYREKNNVSRSDFMDLLIQLKNEDNKKSEIGGWKITLNDIAAQSFLFFIAGFETSASASGLTLYELAKNPEIQRKVQEECDRVMQACEGKVTYEILQTMEYTEMVLQEVMRLYPALTFLPRAAVRSCTLPLTDVKLDKDTIIWIPLYAFHKDEELFPEPEKFDPERFSEENKKNIAPYSYMPFGEGPRLCIGNRFAMVQMKSVLLQLMSRYSVELSDEVSPIVTIEPTSFITAPLSNIKLRMISRKSD